MWSSSIHSTAKCQKVFSQKIWHHCGLLLWWKLLRYQQPLMMRFRSRIKVDVEVDFPHSRFWSSICHWKPFCFVMEKINNFLLFWDTVFELDKRFWEIFFGKRLVKFGCMLLSYFNIMNVKKDPKTRVPLMLSKCSVCNVSIPWTQRWRR